MWLPIAHIYPICLFLFCFFLFLLLLLFFSHRRHARLASLERHCGGKASLSCAALTVDLKCDGGRGTRCNCMISCFVSAFFVTCFCNRRRCKHQLQQYFPHRWQLKLKYLFVIVLFTSFHWLDASLGGWVRRNDKLCSTSVHHWWWVWQWVNKLNIQKKKQQVLSINSLIVGFSISKIWMTNNMTNTHIVDNN